MTSTGDRMRAACFRVERHDGSSPHHTFLDEMADEADRMVQEERAAHVVTNGALAGVLVDVVKERHRQDAKFGWIGAETSIMPGDNEWQKYAVLGEEVGEIANALLERSLGNDTIEHIEEEIIQVAAVAVAWVQGAREKRAQAKS